MPDPTPPPPTTPPGLPPPPLGWGASKAAIDAWNALINRFGADTAREIASILVLFGPIWP